jgi:hypothetical protein
MKPLRLPAIVILGVLLCQTAPLLASPPADTNAPVNYVIQVRAKDAKGNVSSLQVTTIDGHFELDTLQKNTVQINNTEIPATLKMNGTLTTMNEQKGLLKLFLGRTVPYVTSTYNNGSAMGTASSYSQLSVGLDSAFVVTFGRPLVIQVDDSGEVSVLVTREEN